MHLIDKAALILQVERWKPAIEWMEIRTSCCDYPDVSDKIDFKANRGEKEEGRSPHQKE